MFLALMFLISSCTNQDLGQDTPGTGDLGDDSLLEFDEEENFDNEESGVTENEETEENAEEQGISSQEPASSRKLYFSAWLDVPSAAYQPIDDFIARPYEEYEVPDEKTQKKNLETWFARFKENGVNVASVYIIDFEGTLYYNSLTLKKIGYEEDQQHINLMQNIFSLAKKYDMVLSLNIESLAHIYSKTKEFNPKINRDMITPGLVQEVIDELATAAKQNGVEIWINEEAFNLEFIKAIDEATNRNGVMYAHFFEQEEGLGDIYISEDYIIASGKNSFGQADVNSVGVLNHLFSHGKTIGKKTGCLTSGGWGLVHGVQQNICLFRNLQWNPEFYSFITGGNDDGSFNFQEHQDTLNYDYSKLQNLIEKFGPKHNDANKKSANVIIKTALPELEEWTLYSFAKFSTWNLASNSLLAAGYNVKLTYNDPLPDADLYYIIAPASFDGYEIDLPDNLALLADETVPVWYHPIGIPREENWIEIIKKAGGSASGTSSVPASISYKFPYGNQEIRFRDDFLDRDDDPYSEESELTTMIGSITAEDVLVSDGDTALVFKKDNLHFVNGPQIDFEFSAVLANLFSQRHIYNKKSMGYLVNGVSRSAFLAIDDTEVDLNILGGSEIYQFNENSEPIEPTVKLEGNRAYGQVPKWHLLIII